METYPLGLLTLEIIRLTIGTNQLASQHNIQRKMMYLRDLAPQLTQKQISEPIRQITLIEEKR